MSLWTPTVSFFPKATGDPGRDRHARTVQFACLVLACAVSIEAVMNIIADEPKETPVLIFAVAGLIAATVMNRAGRWEWAARFAVSAVLLTAMLMVFEARDGFRSLAMLLFPGMLLLSVLLLDRASYMITSGIVLVAVAAIGLAERQGLTRAIPRVRSATTYESIFFVDLTLLVFAVIGSRIARDAQRNVFELRATIDRALQANFELRNTSDVLKESEQQLVSIYNTVQDVIFHLAVESEGRFRFVSVNAAFLRVTGLSREMVVGKTVNEVIPPPSLEMILKKYRQAIEENTAVLWEETSAYPAGLVTGEVTIVPIFDNHGTCTHLVGSVHDITERKKAEIALRESQEQFHTVANTAPVMIWTVDLNRLCTFVNKPWCDFKGRTMEQELGNGWAEGIHPEDMSQCLATYHASFDARRSFQIEYRLRRADGEYRRILDSGTPQYRNGEFTGYIGSCVDVTEARRTQEESFALQKLESLGTLATGIAHDFNNLLGAVLAQTELAISEVESGARPDEELEAVRNATLRGSEIVRQLMIYAGKESDVLELVDCSKVVDGMLDLLKVAVSRHADLVTDPAEGLPAVRARPAQISQIVMNLVVNASEALGDCDGVIRVTTEHIALRRDEAAAKGLPDGDYVRLKVSDTGSGMSPDTQAKLFDPFFTTKFSGRGLGLAVVHGIVRSLQGAIQVASELGKGTTFQVLLPCAEADAKSDPAGVHRAAEPAPPAPWATILIVEDEEQLRLGVAKMLRKAGWETLEAANGTAAIDLLRASEVEIDLVLLDLTIPGSSSLEVIDEAELARPDLKVILTSAYSEEVAGPLMSAPPVCGFIRKPFELGQLMQKLRSAVLS